MFEEMRGLEARRPERVRGKGERFRAKKGLVGLIVEAVFGL